ncbi:hypothetical protein BKH46_00090 [Helicobacter sp. 12S02634-8]|uniref:hypothetical protein n=1 Tax=Helicobacter sp. 12S02634-8 TaxID=1476199 RepID=UPI000BA60C5B|nr:hypothetical protein [Helicobacter sp. 12S02634-8]PAF48360.1 hypothetical protein BKH46_00090 [Helicobacter sp. 12S02634-8]
MACKFCPKIRKFDLVLIVIVCVAFYGVDKYQSKQREKSRVEAFEALQKACLYGDTYACKKVYAGVDEK